MTTNPSTADSPLSAQSGLLPLRVSIEPINYLYGNTPIAITIFSGLTVFLGPNGTGKTQALRAAHASLRVRLPGAVRYLSAGRSAPLEEYRSASTGPTRNSEPATVGHTSLVLQRHRIESVTGDFLALYHRPDLRIKVEARLHSLIGKRLHFQWTQSGLQIDFVGKDGNYSASGAASGVVQLVAVLAALYDNEVTGLIIDEPETSLHPQWQSFLLKEIETVAGDPLVDGTKKLVIIGTHSMMMLPFRRLTDIPNFVFFNSSDLPPKQVDVTDGTLESKSLSALFGRIGESYRMAFFAKTVLLLEGTSDEIICNALALQLRIPMGLSSAQIVPVLGVSEMFDSAKLFRLMGKRVACLADLDALTDTTELVLLFSGDAAVSAKATSAGAKSAAKMDESLRADFATEVDQHWSDIEPLVSSHQYIALANGKPSVEHKRRAALVALLTNDSTTLPSSGWVQLKSRFKALLHVLEEGGCFFISRGTIEDCFSIHMKELSKPQAAVSEAATFPSREDADLRRSYSDPLRALEYACPNPTINEAPLLRIKLATMLAAVFQQMGVDSSDTDLRQMALAGDSEAATVFNISNVSDAASGQKAIKVSFASPLFASTALPRVVFINQNLTEEVQKALP